MEVFGVVAMTPSFIKSIMKQGKGAMDTNDQAYKLEGVACELCAGQGERIVRIIWERAHGRSLTIAGPDFKRIECVRCGGSGRKDLQND